MRSGFDIEGLFLHFCLAMAFLSKNKTVSKILSNVDSRHRFQSTPNHESSQSSTQRFSAFIVLPRSIPETTLGNGSLEGGNRAKVGMYSIFTVAIKYSQEPIRAPGIQEFLISANVFNIRICCKRTKQVIKKII